MVEEEPIAPQEQEQQEDIIITEAQNPLAIGAEQSQVDLDSILAPPGDGSKPVMNTFFQYITPDKKQTGMSDTADNALLDLWKAKWTEAGWEPRVLNLQHAQAHPDYTAYEKELDKIPMMGVDGKGGNIVYNKLCFLRWLAMAAVGGGWMSDYDVFPLEADPSAEQDMIMPREGNFSVYSVVKDSGGLAGIPCLMSGRSDEWTRMAHTILENGIDHAEHETMWSDMFALIDLRKAQAYGTKDAVVEGQDVLVSHAWTTQDCELTHGKYAVHFSHEAMFKGHLEEGETTEDRPLVIQRFYSRWTPSCEGGSEIGSGRESGSGIGRRVGARFGETITEEVPRSRFGETIMEESRFGETITEERPESRFGETIMEENRFGETVTEELP
eukprot:CAMPEP_0118706238 /NCGR_PEP_ID=MMETSP0800-20121206/20424_1 /TAXON_ID=210618 ORGANISM="Striatella unipunctata, Strain CCMP2910" /NCGR_SAMPLE_ID=MMETSP0800 /ASSEMBLY_ACC=CAM_ASM_000638 /LENGTH=384 /DNA_ID=CAMNT_0006608705 /DNA_START=72 /DNA_END=1223 /DNA_ORIENTATION=+